MNNDAINPSENPEPESPPFNPPEADQLNFVRSRVFSILAKVAGIDVHKIHDNSHLMFDLSINVTEKWLLMREFNLLLKGMHSMKFVNKDECLRLVFASDCVKLVLYKLH